MLLSSMSTATLAESIGHRSKPHERFEPLRSTQRPLVRAGELVRNRRTVNNLADQRRLAPLGASR